MIKVNPIIKWSSITMGIGIYAYVLGIIFFYDDFESPTYQELTANYELNHKKIHTLKNYVNSIVPPNNSIHIEFENDHTLSIFHVLDDKIYDDNWNIDIQSEKTDSLLQKLGWNKTTLKTLKTHLDQAHCVSVSSGKPFNIGFQRRGMGMFFYNLFDKPIIDEQLKRRYNDSCQYILYNDHVVLEWGGGVLGTQCFPGY